eukprot:149896-Pyramimonas_sp.AAC.2
MHTPLTTLSTPLPPRRGALPQGGARYGYDIHTPLTSIHTPLTSLSTPLPPRRGALPQGGARYGYDIHTSLTTLSTLLPPRRGALPQGGARYGYVPLFANAQTHKPIEFEKRAVSGPFTSVDVLTSVCLACWRPPTSERHALTNTHIRTSELLNYNILLVV